MEHSSSSNVRARQLGAALKQSRRAAGMAGEFVAGKLGVSVSKISRMESGHRSPKLEDVAGLLALYGITGKTRQDLLTLCREAASGETGWWQQREMSKKQRTLIELESATTRIVNYTSLLLPGLLQTGEYARTVFREVMLDPENEIEDRMVTRLARHSVLMRNQPPRLLAIIYEPALQLPIGGPDVQRRQLHHLILSAQQAHITIHVVPQSVGVHPGLHAPFTKFEFADAPPVVFLENQTSCLFLEGKEDISSYDAVLDKLLTLALSAGESAQLLADLANNVCQEPHEETINDTSEAGSSIMA